MIPAPPVGSSSAPRAVPQETASVSCSYSLMGQGIKYAERISRSEIVEKWIGDQECAHIIPPHQNKRVHIYSILFCEEVHCEIVKGYLIVEGFGRIFGSYYRVL